jgi:MarR family transcriptional regulator, organic hydroperoxide resistance regulator
MKPQDSIDYQIKTAWYNIFRMYTQLASKYDATQAIGHILINLNENEGVSPVKIAALIGIQQTGLSRLLNNMEKKGLIFRKGDDNDKRMVKIFLTDKGMEKRKLARKTVRTFNNYLESSLNKEKLAVFFEVVKEINVLTNNYIVD